MMSAFGPIYDTPYGTAGDLMLVPDPSTYVEVEFDDNTAERFYLGDIQMLSGQFWPCCPRHFLRLRRWPRSTPRPGSASSPRSSRNSSIPASSTAKARPIRSTCAWRRQGSFGEETLSAIRRAEARARTGFLPEYGPRQYEMTISPGIAGLRAADDAIIAREMARAVATSARRARDLRADPRSRRHRQRHAHPFQPARPGQPAGHVRPPTGRGAWGRRGRAFLRRHPGTPAAALTAVTAPSGRLVLPAATQPLGADLGQCPGLQDRGASLRICSIFDQPANRNFNVEYRVADASACPYLALGAIVLGRPRRGQAPARPAAVQRGELLGHERRRGSARRPGRGQSCCRARSARRSTSLAASAAARELVWRRAVRHLYPASSAPS